MSKVKEFGICVDEAFPVYSVYPHATGEYMDGTIKLTSEDYADYLIIKQAYMKWQARIAVEHVPVPTLTLQSIL